VLTLNRPELQKEKGKSFLVKLMQNLALALVEPLVENFLFPESLVEIFSKLRKDHQKNSKNIELRTKNNGTER